MYSENSKIVICLDSFLNKFIICLIPVFETTALLKFSNLQHLLWLLLPDLIGSLMRFL